MYEAFDFHKIVNSDCINEYPRLFAFYNKMDSLPELQNAKKTRIRLHPLFQKLISQTN